MKTIIESHPSSVHFHNSQVAHATNDGMEVLGHFLLTQVGADRNAFFTKWLQEPADDTITSGPYYVEKIGDQVFIDHFENDAVEPLETTRKHMLEIIKHWHGWCASNQSSACGTQGYDVSITRTADGRFEFHAHTVH